MAVHMGGEWRLEMGCGGTKMWEGGGRLTGGEEGGGVSGKELCRCLTLRGWGKTWGSG